MTKNIVKLDQYIMNTFFVPTYKFFSYIILIISLNSCMGLFRHECDWAFIQSVGGIKIDEPYLTKDGWFLPVQCDVSGLTTITNKPTTMNSALKCVKVGYFKKKSSVFITIYTGSIGYRNKTCRCDGINIGHLKEGEYSIYYKYKNDLHLIKSIKLK